MVLGKMPLSRQSPLSIDFDLESVPIGPATRMIVLETDPEGGLFYQFGRRKAQYLQLPSEFGLCTVGIIDMLHTAAIIDPQSHRLRALAIFTSEGSRILLTGARWGQWIDGHGQIHKEANLPEAIKTWKTPVLIQESRGWVAFDFIVNIYFHEIFTQEAKLSFREGPVYHTVKLCFDYPSGNFKAGRVGVHDKETHRVNYVFELDEFPLALPDLKQLPQPKAPPRASIPPRQPAKPSRPIPQGPPMTPHPAPHKDTPAPEPPTPAANRPLPVTDHLSIHELLSVLSTETDPDRRWRIIEINLMRARPERTYPMIQRYPELIAEHTRTWIAIKLKAVFTNQPGSVLIHIMNHWQVNQVLAVSEDNAESDHILEWLHEREIDRLLHMDLGSEPQTPVQARRVLRVDRNASSREIRKTWRTLLSFLNVDHGRSQERAIHRHKDEIAKHIQAARDILMKTH